MLESGLRGTLLNLPYFTLMFVGRKVVYATKREGTPVSLVFYRDGYERRVTMAICCIVILLVNSDEFELNIVEEPPDENLKALQS